VPRLRELQLRFSASLLDAAGRYAADQVIAGAIAGEERIGFYRTNLLSNYRDTLSAVYPVVEQLVGTRFFRRAADCYQRVYPSASGDLNGYGERFAEFLESFAPARSLEYLADVARLEWLIEESFYAADATPFALAELASVAPDRQSYLTFSLHPACRLLSSSFPVRKIWATHQPGWQGNFDIDVNAGGELLLVRRENFQVVIEPLDHGSFCALSLLAGGRNLEEAYRYAGSVQGDFDLENFLRCYIVNGVLSDFDWPLSVELAPKDPGSAKRTSMAAGENLAS
jgi:Putative DNA-binding domain